MDLAGWIERSAKERRPLASPVELDDEASLRVDRSVLVFGAAVVALVVIWSAITPIRELAVAPGQIAPAAQIRVLQHPEGGVVDVLAARPGDVVKAGDPILRLAPVATESDFGQLEARRRALVERRDQLNALLAIGELRLGGQSANLAPIQQRLFDNRSAKAEADRKALEARVGQRAAEIEALRREVQSAARLVAVHEEQRDIRAELFPKGYSSRRDLLEAEATLESAKLQASSAAGRLKAAEESLAEAKQSLASLVAEARSRWSEELATAEAELAETEAALARQAERVTRLVVRSPIDGTVMEVIPTSRGDVVPPGEVVARVVPGDGELVAEVRLAPDDVGEVVVGHEAEIQVTTFDPNVYGRLTGTVRELSASTFYSPEGEPYYKALLALDRTSLGDEAHPRQLKPGMTVQAHIVTGEKSLLRYLLKPIYRNFGLAFSER